MQLVSCAHMTVALHTDTAAGCDGEPRLQVAQLDRLVRYRPVGHSVRRSQPLRCGTRPRYNPFQLFSLLCARLLAMCCQQCVWVPLLARFTMMLSQTTISTRRCHG